eukprot:366438-Chlamydomonas_euryale.AAC.5
MGLVVAKRRSVDSSGRVLAHAGTDTPEVAQARAAGARPRRQGHALPAGTSTRAKAPAARRHIHAGSRGTSTQAAGAHARRQQRHTHACKGNGDQDANRHLEERPRELRLMRKLHKVNLQARRAHARVDTGNGRVGGRAPVAVSVGLFVGLFVLIPRPGPASHLNGIRFVEIRAISRPPPRLPRTRLRREWLCGAHAHTS